MARNVRLDHRGLAQLLKSAPMRGLVSGATESVASRLRGMEPDYPVTSQVVTTDRAHGIVAIAHPAGEAIQAKRGSLTKAAAQAGFTVKDRRG
jgi:hypothetical protein